MQPAISKLLRRYGTQGARAADACILATLAATHTLTLAPAAGWRPNHSWLLRPTTHQATDWHTPALAHALQHSAPRPHSVALRLCHQTTPAAEVRRTQKYCSRLFFVVKLQVILRSTLAAANTSARINATGHMADGARPTRSKCSS
jgi:hypothetical protein